MMIIIALSNRLEEGSCSSAGRPEILGETHAVWPGCASTVVCEKGGILGWRDAIDGDAELIVESGGDGGTRPGEVEVDGEC